MTALDEEAINQKIIKLRFAFENEKRKRTFTEQKKVMNYVKDRNRLYVSITRMEFEI
jgi:hypothetical protein